MHARKSNFAPTRPYCMQRMLKFPAFKKKIRPDAIAEITNGGRDHATLSKQDRRAVVRMVQDNVMALAETEPQALLALKAISRLVTPAQLIERYQEMFGKELAEGKWQSFLKNPLSWSGFCRSCPDGSGASICRRKAAKRKRRKNCHFLYASASTGNPYIIETKSRGPNC